MANTSKATKIDTAKMTGAAAVGIVPLLGDSYGISFNTTFPAMS
jgi:hypothetical protein